MTYGYSPEVLPADSAKLSADFTQLAAPEDPSMPGWRTCRNSTVANRIRMFGTNPTAPRRAMPGTRTRPSGESRLERRGPPTVQCLANASYHALADRTDVALGTVAGCMNDLAVRGLLLNGKGGRRVEDRHALVAGGKRSRRPNCSCPRLSTMARLLEVGCRGRIAFRRARFEQTTLAVVHHQNVRHRQLQGRPYSRVSLPSRR